MDCIRCGRPCRLQTTEGEFKLRNRRNHSKYRNHAKLGVKANCNPRGGLYRRHWHTPLASLGTRPLPPWGYIGTRPLPPWDNRDSQGSLTPRQACELVLFALILKDKLFELFQNNLISSKSIAIALVDFVPRNVYRLLILFSHGDYGHIRNTKQQLKIWYEMT